MCHGPDASERKGGRDGLRLDTADGAQADLGGFRAIVPGRPEESELIQRITTTDPADLMPPPKSGKRLSAADVAVLREWIAGGAVFAQHWSYVRPVRPPLPEVKLHDWPRHPMDRFILARLEKEGLTPSEEADRWTLARRVALDLTGLPPTSEEADSFARDTSPDAFERLVDRLLAKESYGEHWARRWLDLARYADSSGYADDPPRTIWAYRDYVIRALNQNKPFDQFTVEQLAGDLLPEPTEDQLIATAFHRNTQTNNEGGTSDEEFRNVAVVDRVNTTMAVWMGTTMACAQCHDHKYDPISQADYFRFFAILNNSADADRADESPVLPLYTPEQQHRRKEWQNEIDRLEQAIQTVTPELAAAQQRWEAGFTSDPAWEILKPLSSTSNAGAAMESLDDGSTRFERAGPTDTYTLELPLPSSGTLTAVRLETLPDDRPPGGGVGHAGGNFVITRVRASVVPSETTRPAARFVRVELPGREKILSLAEVQVFSGNENVAPTGEARHSSTAFDGSAALAIDGNTRGDFAGARSTTHTETSENPWWELDLQSARPVDRLVIWNRTDGNLESRLAGFTVALLDEQRAELWRAAPTETPRPSLELSPGGVREISLAAAFADHEQPGFEAVNVLRGAKDKGWSVAPHFGVAHQLTLIPGAGVDVSTGSKLLVSIEQQSKFAYATVGRVQLAASYDSRAPEQARTPAGILALIRRPSAERTAEESETLSRHFLSVCAELQPQRTRLAELQRRLKDDKPYTTVPVLKELAGSERRATHLQRRGNFLDVGEELTPGLPSAFPAPETDGSVDRLALARWLVSPENPLTARVIANRLWESIFGLGLVRTSEEFGAQGELPSHPELLDWLAVELVECGWDMKKLLRLLVTSATYRQSSKVTPELAARDPENQLLARGPRFRLSAEMVRDQALFAGGLLSSKMYGPPVRPPQPSSGLSAAFGGKIDWETSTGEDRHRRALYTQWRRSNPYPSMTTFDAPNSEVCTVRRERSNTPLQALVTLNDPVYVEAAQALARRSLQHATTPSERARFAFRQGLARPPRPEELTVLLKLYARAYERFVSDAEAARLAATDPVGPLPDGAEPAELAAWTVVASIILNLDEALMKP